MSKELKAKQVAAYKNLQFSLAEFCKSVKEVRDEDPNNQVTTEMVRLHDILAIEFTKSIMHVISRANRNFLKVVTDENDQI